MYTGQIDRLTEKGIQMKDGEHIDADFIISATGLTLQHNYPFSTIKVWKALGTIHMLGDKMNCTVQGDSGGLGVRLG